MPYKPYFLTEDLEVTAGVSHDALLEIREQGVGELAKAFSREINIRTISHNEGSAFFKSREKSNGYTIAAEDGIYIKDADLYFDSTRMFLDEKAILLGESKSMQRDGSKLAGDIVLPDSVEEVTIIDDGIFSGGTINEVIKRLKYKTGQIQTNVTVLLNFSQKVNPELPINAMYTGDCIDWIDERDFYYGVRNSGASINSNGLISGIPYISNPTLASRKASIPENTSKEFCLNMLQVNKRVFPSYRLVFRSNFSISL